MEDGTPVVNQIGTGASAVFPQGVPHPFTGSKAHWKTAVFIKLHALKPRFERPERATHYYSPGHQACSTTSRTWTATTPPTSSPTTPRTPAHRCGSIPAKALVHANSEKNNQGQAFLPGAGALRLTRCWGNTPQLGYGARFMACLSWSQRGAYCKLHPCARDRCFCKSAS